MKLVSNIEKIKILTESLVDRDYIRVKIINLFDKFCNDFPIPMNAWIVDEKMKIISTQGSFSNSKESISCVDNLFTGEQKDKNTQMHRQALNGEIVTYTLTLDDKILLTKLIPSDKRGKIVFGISMDVTSFFNAFSALEAHCDDISDSECDLVKKVKNDKLYKILTSGG